MDEARAFGSLGPTGSAFARGATTSLAAGAAAAVAQGGKISVQRVAVDAFGNALATATISAAQRPGEQAQLVATITAQDQAYLQKIQALGAQLTDPKRYPSWQVASAGAALDMPSEGTLPAVIVTPDDVYLENSSLALEVGNALGVSNARSAQGTIQPIGEVDGFFTFNPVGRAFKGAGTVGYASSAIAPQRKCSHRPTVRVLGTLGSGITGAVQNAPGTS